MIISFLNQKGGTGKSTLARAVAVEFVNNDWSVHLADMDVTQQTSFKWAGRREEAGITPLVEVSVYREAKAALKSANNADLLVIDGKAFADSESLEVAKHSDLIVLPVGVSVDDLEPTLRLASDLINKGVARSSILFVVSKVMQNGDREAMQTRSTIKNWAFEVAVGWIPMQTAYSQAMDLGRTLTETRFKRLNESMDKIIQQIVSKALQTQQ